MKNYNYAKGNRQRYVQNSRINSKFLEWFGYLILIGILGIILLGIYQIFIHFFG